MPESTGTKFSSDTAETLTITIKCYCVINILILYYIIKIYSLVRIIPTNKGVYSNINGNRGKNTNQHAQQAQVFFYSYIFAL